MLRVTELKLPLDHGEGELRAAILARNPEDARSAMIEHLDKVHQRFSASWRQAHPPA